MGIISAAALSFIVHEPRGIIVRSRARSEAAQVAQHFVFAVVAVEHRLVQDRITAPIGEPDDDRCCVASALGHGCAEQREHTMHHLGRGGLVEADAHVAIVDASQVEACGACRGEHRVGIALDGERVEPRLVHQRAAGTAQPGGNRGSQAVHPFGDASQAVGTVPAGVHPGHVGQ
jgi:hypothetical protein